MVLQRPLFQGICQHIIEPQHSGDFGGQREDACLELGNLLPPFGIKLVLNGFSVFRILLTHRCWVVQNDPSNGMDMPVEPICAVFIHQVRESTTQLSIVRLILPRLFVRGFLYAQRVSAETGTLEESIAATGEGLLYFV